MPAASAESRVLVKYEVCAFIVRGFFILGAQSRDVTARPRLAIL